MNEAKKAIRDAFKRQTRDAYIYSMYVFSAIEENLINISWLSEDSEELYIAVNHCRRILNSCMTDIRLFASSTLKPQIHEGLRAWKDQYNSADIIQRCQYEGKVALEAYVKRWRGHIKRLTKDERTRRIIEVIGWACILDGLIDAVRVYIKRHNYNMPIPAFDFHVRNLNGEIDDLHKFDTDNDWKNIEKSGWFKHVNNDVTNLSLAIVSPEYMSVMNHCIILELQAAHVQYWTRTALFYAVNGTLPEDVKTDILRHTDSPTDLYDIRSELRMFIKNNNINADEPIEDLFDRVADDKTQYEYMQKIGEKIGHAFVEKYFKT